MPIVCILSQTIYSFFKVCEQSMAVLAGSRFTHDLATPACLLLACRHAAMTGGCKGIDRQRAIVIHRRVKRPQQRRTLLHQSNADVATAMHPTLVACGTFDPALHIHLVFWKIGGLSTHQHPGPHHGARGTSGRCKASAAVLCSALHLTLLRLGTPEHCRTQTNFLQPKDGTECPGHLFHVGVIDVAKHANDTAFIDDPNLLAEDYRIVG